MKAIFIYTLAALSVLSCGFRNARSASAANMESAPSQEEALAIVPVDASETVSFDKTVHDFGDVSTADGPLTCTFTLTNTGKDPIAIFEVVSSCGCTDVKWTKEPLQPGKSGTIQATYKNEDGPIPFDKTLTVYISGVKKPVILRLRGVVHEQKKSLSQLFGDQKLGDFGLKTRQLKTATLKQGLSVSESTTVANLGKQPLKLAWQNVTPELSLQVTPNPIPAGSTATLSWTVKASAEKYGKNSYFATPVLNGEAATAPLEIISWTQENFADWTKEQVNQGALPYFQTSTFSFGVVPSGTKVDVSFECTNKGASAFHIYKADADSPALSVNSLPEIGAQQKGTLSLTLDTSALPHGDTVIMLTLTTNSPLRPLINLFVAGSIQPCWNPQ